jgi:hypothetical protein
MQPAAVLAAAALRVAGRRSEFALSSIHSASRAHSFLLSQRRATGEASGDPFPGNEGDVVGGL